MMCQRIPPCYCVVAIILAISTSGAAASESCPQLAQRTIAGINSAFVRMEPANYLSLLRSQLQKSLRVDCQDDPAAAYADLRLRELGAGVASPVGILSPEQRQTVLETAAGYTQRFPASAPIATIFARASHLVAAAQTAVQLDPDYPPAQAALAEALLLDGQPEQAQTILHHIPDLAVLSDGYALQARILLARGDTDGAILAARNGLHKRRVTALIEPDGTSMLPVSQAYEVLGLAYLQRRQYKAAAQALIDARFGSERADSLLRNPPEGLQQALRARHFKPE